MLDRVQERRGRTAVKGAGGWVGTRRDRDRGLLIAGQPAGRYPGWADGPNGRPDARSGGPGARPPRRRPAPDLPLPGARRTPSAQRQTLLVPDVFHQHGPGHEGHRGVDRANEERRRAGREVEPVTGTPAGEGIDAQPGEPGAQRLAAGAESARPSIRPQSAWPVASGNRSVKLKPAQLAEQPAPSAGTV